jgi:hypothetical protein
MKGAAVQKKGTDHGPDKQKHLAERAGWKNQEKSKQSQNEKIARLPVPVRSPETYRKTRIQWSIEAHKFRLIPNIITAPV